MSRGWVTRPARPADADRIGAVHVRCWRYAYPGAVADEVLAALDPVEWAARWRTRLTGPGSSETWLAVRGHPSGAEKLGAFGSAGPARDADGEAGELYALYADPTLFGTGAGHTAHEAALAGLRAAGYPSAVLWVLAANTSSRRFYARHGWCCDGVERTTPIHGAELTVVRYSRWLRDPGLSSGPRASGAGSGASPGPASPG